MAKELYHFHFRKPHQPLRFALSISGTAIAILGIILLIFQFTINTKYNLLEGYFYAVIVMAAIGVLVYVLAKVRGGDVDESEFILYDNGWFAFWRVDDQVWIAPTKLEWIYQEHIDLPPLHIKSKYNVYYIAKKKGNNYFVIFRLLWGYPDKNWENWVFHGIVRGLLTKEEFEKFSEMIKLLRNKAKENIDSGRVKVPENNPKQGHIDYYTRSQYWDVVFEKENLRELYRKETGEDIPEPIRSYLFDEKKFKEVYLKNKRETGDWVGKKGSETKE